MLTCPVLLIYFLNAVSFETPPRILLKVVVGNHTCISGILSGTLIRFRNASVPRYDIHNESSVSTPEGSICLKEPEMHDSFVKTVIYIEEPEDCPFGVGIRA